MEYTKITQPEFNTNYDNHVLWLEDSSKGKQLDFSNCDLTNIIIGTKRNFKNSICKNTLFPYGSDGIDFTNSDLTNSNFRGCQISGTDFENATLVNLDFEEVELGHANFTNAYILNCNFTGDKPKHLENAIAKTNELITKNSSSNVSINNKETTSLAKIVTEKLGNQLAQGLKITLAKKSSEIITNNIKKALIAAKIPKILVNNPLFSALLTISAPQLLKILLPHIPQLKTNANALKLLELACQGSVTSVTTETLEYIISQTLPIIKQLESPKMKEIVMGLE